VSLLQVLDATNPAERARWLEAWNAWPGKEVSAHPDYVALFARDRDRSLCALLSLPSGGILYPFILRPLSSEPWAPPGTTAADLVTPYGYGGPFAWGEAALHAEQFWDQLDVWAGAANVVTSFVRLSVFPEQMIPFRGVIEERQHNVVRSLDLDLEHMWRDYAHKVRKNVNRAKLAGLEVLVDTAGARLAEFHAIYLGTMQRRGALPTYCFPLSFFAAVVGKLPGSFVFFHVLDQKRMVSSELVLVSDNYLYSFLGGTTEDAFELRPNDLLKHAIVLWGIEQRKRAFVLGGGYQGDDGIYRYKLSLAPKGAVPFRVGLRTYQADSAEQLTAARRKFALSHGVVWEPSPGYFPPYR
jgi:hypothetical protein